jgi:hypothetical protein
MTKEDLKFLKELQHELKTQETDGQAAPRFWGIMETKERITKDWYGDDIYMVDRTGGEAENYKLQDYVDMLGKYIDENEMDYETIAGFAYLDYDDIEKVAEFARNFLDRDVEVSSFEKYEKLSDQTGCFLTKRAAIRHIELNGYHYSKPKTYSMTAWRNPEFERFIRIFENLDLDKLEHLTD